jgi:hypothetical protein
MATLLYLNVTHQQPRYAILNNQLPFTKVDMVRGHLLPDF